MSFTSHVDMFLFCSIPLGENIHSTAGTVSDGTYIGFMVLTFIGACLAWTLIDARNVVRSDGSRVILMKHPSWQSEIWGLWETLRNDVWIVLLFPMFISSNWFYTYQFNDFNSARFNIRTRALNNVLYWTCQIIGAYLFGYGLDIKRIRRSIKARIVWGVLLVLTFAIWGGGYAFQKQYTRGETAPKDSPRKDWTDGGYVGPMFLYMFYGFYDGTPLFNPRPPFTNSVLNSSGLANNNLLVHGRTNQQRAQVGQLHGVLQGDPIRRPSHNLPDRRIGCPLPELFRLVLGPTGGFTYSSESVDLVESAGYGPAGGRPEVHGRDGRGCQAVGSEWYTYPYHGDRRGCGCGCGREGKKLS